MGTLSIVLQANKNSPYSISDFSKTLKSLEMQYDKDFQAVIYGDWQEAMNLAKEQGFIAVEADFSNRAAALNAALEKAGNEYILVCNNETDSIELVRSAVAFYKMVMDRHPSCNLLYADYDLIDGPERRERKLLEFHPGRILETWDMGFCLLFRRSFLRGIGFCDEQYRYKPVYDLRLKAFETKQVVHVSNRFNGTPYYVYAPQQEHDVFAYLKAGKEIAKELERICTEHLKRINAYLAPGQNYKAVTYTEAEEESFKDCLVTVVIPVFNRPEFIGNAIESVQAQTVKNIEIVVVCNGGEDDPTVGAVKEYMHGGSKFHPEKPTVRLIVHDMNNLGLCFNSALQSSKAKYYMQLDSDDLLFENAIEKVLEVYDQDDRIGMVIGSYQVFEKQDNGDIAPILLDGNPFVVTHEEWTEENGRNNLLRVGGAGAPRSIKIKVLENMGWFGMNDSPYCRNYGEDYELVNKVAEHHRIGRVWEPIYKVVRHSGGTDHSIDQVTIDVNENAKDIMRLYAIRRRQIINRGASGEKIDKNPF
ncbi:glycosyltransferase [candidate division KSB1 bacterium]|nr:glycosyltransferase [candidate division KSB1 bacterium]